MKNNFRGIKKAFLTVVFTVIFCGIGFGQTSIPLSRTNWDVTPAGWTDYGTGSYTTSYACTNSNSGKLDNTSDYYEVYFNSQPDQLVFKLKKASMSGESYLIVEESADGNSWGQIGNYGTASASTAINDCGDITITLNSTTRYVKWTYTKSTGNCVIDDVNITSAITKPEPTNHTTSFTAIENGHNQIDLSWFDNDGAQAADGFLIKANTNGSFTSPADATDPAEDSDLSDGTALVKIAYGTQSYSFTGLSELTQYYFKIWPYTNSGSDINFKTDGTVPEDSATTTSIPVVPSIGVVFITEVSDASSNIDAEFIELYNTSDDIIDLSNCHLQMLPDNTSFTITSYTGDYQIPAKGFLIIARSATLIEFEAEWSALPANVNYNEGSGGMYIGTSTARRWQLVYNDGSKANIIIDDSQTAVGGDGNTSIQETSGSWTTINVSSATPGELQSGDQQTLPIKLTHFTAENNSAFNLINWTTASEENNAYFTLEKSYNASDFFEIAEIKGAGNSISELNYQFQDFETSDKTVYYRLKQTDFDGSSSYSEIISIDNNKKNNFSILNSFVADNQININIKSYQQQSINLNITNLNGQIVFSKEFKISNGINNLKIDKTKFKNSVYLITIKNQAYLESEKIVLF